MRIKVTWQPEDTDGPQTVFVEDATERLVELVAAAVELGDPYADAEIELPNVALSDGDPKRSPFRFRVGRLLSYEVQQ